MSRRHNKTGRSTTSRYVRLEHFLLETAAWKDCDPHERATYVELAKRYRGPGSNNGPIALSIREVADSLHSGKTKAANALAGLIRRGLIVVTTKGHFDWKTGPATEYRLTEYPCDVTGQPATKEFVRWRPEVAPENQNPVPQRGPSVPVDGLSGTRTRTVAA